MATIYYDKARQKWFLQWRENGKRHYKVAGKTKREAHAALKAKIKELDRAKYVPSVRTVTPREVFSFLQDYLPRHKSERTARRYLDALRHLRDFCSLKHFPSFTDIRPRHIEEYMAWREEAGVTSGTIDSERTMLSSLWKIAINNEFAVENVVRNTKGPYVERKDIRSLDKDEIQRLLDAADNYYRAVWSTFLLTGMRRGELLKLEWRDVDFARKNITIRPTSDKKRRGRSIPMHSALVTILKNLPRRSKRYVFANGEGSQLRHLWRTLNRTCLRAKIKPVSVHELRDTAATHLIEKGANVFSVQKILGHADLKSTMKYVHLDGRHLQKDMERLDIL